MSQESVKKFLEEFEKNETLKSQIKEAAAKLPENEAKDESKQASIIAECAQKAGYDVSAEELLATKKLADSDNEQLSMDDLDAVAGGGFWDVMKRVASGFWEGVKCFFS